VAGYALSGKNGWNLKKFINSFDYSLELIKLRDTYAKTIRRKDFSFEVGRKEYSRSVINVTFKYCVKAYNQVRRGLYVKYGYRREDAPLLDRICRKDGEVIAIETGRPVEVPAPDADMPRGFSFENGVYKAKDSIETIKSAGDIRAELYENGFICDGIKYVRYKRSAGSARTGKCLFIDERLRRPMMKWSLRGLKFKEGGETDLAALESYISLTLSGIIGTVEIKPENILVIDDYKSIFRDRAAATKLIDGRLATGEEEVEISNSIWDGQSLLDASMFGKYSKRGMLLLRKRFFKSCCFNTNLNKWFADNGVTDVKQLRGFTLARNIEDIKLITTPSSVKFLKFGALRDWLNCLDSAFGIVKHDKPSHFFNGGMVRTHYQLLNTIRLTYGEVGEVLAPSFDYLAKIKTSPAVLRHRIKYGGESADCIEPPYSRNDVIYKLLGANEDFSKTKLYDNFRRDLMNSMIKDLRMGHILVDGVYGVLFGNPMCMLKSAINRFDGVSEFGKGEIYCGAFKNGEELLGSRSPHVTMGNILIATNNLVSDIGKYFNLTKEIACINSIGENTLELLSGADFDSDAALITNNKILINGAKRDKDKFGVPTKMVESAASKRRYAAADLADLDIKTSANKIGQIINLSQELNSKLWDAVNRKTGADIKDIYNAIAQLDVMSNLEIDSAKRENPADNGLELTAIKKKFETRDDNGAYIKPAFFKYIERYKGYRVGGRKAYIYHETAMDYVERHINRFKAPKTETEGFTPLSGLIKKDGLPKINWKQINSITDMLGKLGSDVKKIWKGDLDGGEKYRETFKMRDRCYGLIGKMKLNDGTLARLLAASEEDKYSGIRRSLTDILFGIMGERLLGLMTGGENGVTMLKENRFGDVDLYGRKFSERVRR
jgi:hypothetical protein